MTIPEQNTIQAFEDWAKQVSIETGFALGEQIYQGTYYSAGYIRDAIYAGTYQGQAAVLKLYDDPRLCDEPLALQAFHERNDSRLLRAPKLYRYELDSAARGWLIMERLPAGGVFFRSPLLAQDQAKFMDAYVEYRRHFPAAPQRPLSLIEQLPAHEYHRLRLSQWLQLANNQEQERRLLGQAPLLAAKEFLPKYVSALAMIDEEYRQRGMVWCHGHIKPSELYQTAEGKIYLTDFAHAKPYPEGYELAFIVWADRLMSADWRVAYNDWRAGIETWIKLFHERQNEIGCERLDDLLRAALLERSLGTILADIAASDRPRDEQLARIDHLSRFLAELLEP